MFPRFKLVHKDLHKLGLPQRKYIEVFYFIGATFNFLKNMCNKGL